MCLSLSPLQYYYSGVYDSSTCSSYNLNHAMVITGYGTYGSKDYWLVKNRWALSMYARGHALPTHIHASIG